MTELYPDAVQLVLCDIQEPFGNPVNITCFVEKQAIDMIEALMQKFMDVWCTY